MKKIRWIFVLLTVVALSVTAVACSGKSLIKMKDAAGVEIEIDYNDINTIGVNNESELVDPGFDMTTFQWSDVILHVTFNDETTAAADVPVSEDMIKAESKLKIGHPGTYVINGVFANKVEFSFTIKLYVLTEKTYQVVFYDEDGERVIGSTKYYKEGTVVQPPAMPTKEGYEHIGWTKKGEDALVKDFTVTGDTAFVAKYQSTTCSIGYYYRVGAREVLICTASVPRGGNALDYAPEIPIVAGYSGGRWEDESAMRSVSGDVDFYAIYDSDTVLVTFSYYKYDEGTYYDFPVSGAMALATEGITPPADAERLEEYVFLYWYTERNGKEMRVSFPYRVMGEMKFTAKYVSFRDGSEGLEYDPVVSDGKTVAYRVRGMKNGADTEIVVIPETHLGLPVQAIDDGAFRGVDVGKFVVSANNPYFRVYDDALYNAHMTELIAYPNASARTSFQMRDSVVTVHPYAFYSARALKSLMFAEKTETIGEYALGECSSLTEIVIPEQVSVVPDGFAKNAASLLSVTFPDGVVSIGTEAFYGNGCLKSVQLPYGLQTMGERAFYGCDEMTSVTMLAPVNNVTRHFIVNNGALYRYNEERTNEYYYLYLYPSKYAGSSRATEYGVNSGVREIVSGAFVNASIVGIYVPSSSVAFRARSVVCPLVQSLRFIGGSTVTFDDDTFEGAAPSVLYVGVGTTVVNDLGITTTTRLESGSPYGEFNNDFAYETIGGKAYITAYRGTAEFLSVPGQLGAGTVAGIRSGVFAGLSTLKSVSLPDSLAEIGDGAFAGCRNLTYVSFGSGLQSVGDYAFADCGDKMHFAYEAGTALRDVGEHAFDTVDEAAYTDANGIVCVAGVVLKMSGYRKNAVIPEGATIIAHEAFAGSNYISSLSLERAAGTLVAIKRSAFEGCEELTRVTFPTTTQNGQRILRAIGARAFADCIRLVDTNRPTTGVDGTAFENTNVVSSTCWNVSNGVLYAYNGSSETLVVPDEVTRIHSGVFAENAEARRNVKTLVFGNSVTTIDDEAFAFCDNLTEIIAGSGLNTIGKQAFYGCAALATMRIDEAAPVGDVAYDAFDGTNWLNDYLDDSVIINGLYYKYLGEMEEIHILNYVTKINDRAFYGDTNVRSVKFPDSLREIGEEAFALCNVAKFDFGQNAGNVKTIGKRAFYGCSGLTYMDVRSLTGLERIGESAFRNVKAKDGSTLSVRFAASLLEIGASAFEGSDVSTVIFMSGSKLREINERVFYGCDKLQSVTFEGKSDLAFVAESAFENCTALRVFTNRYGKLEIVGDNAFKGDVSLEIFNVNESYLQEVGKDAFGENKFVTQNDDTMVFIGTVLVKYNGKFTETVTIPVKTTAIGTGAFAGNVYVKHIVFVGNQGESNVREIQASAFEGCTGLQELILPASIQDIREKAFYGCTSLASVDFASVRSIGVQAFGGCTALTTVSLPASMTEFGTGDDIAAEYGGGVFVGCTSLTRIDVAEGGAYVARDGVLFSLFGDRRSALVAYPNAKVTGVYDVPGSIRVNDVDYNVVGLGEYAFARSNPSAVTAINLPDLTYIGKWAFADIDAVVNFSTEATIVGIGAYAFAEYKGSEITLPDSTERIGEHAFENVTNVLTLVVPKKVDSLGAYAFTGTTMAIVWENDTRLTTIGDYAFVGYEGAEIVLPATVTTIGRYAFDGVSSVLTIEPELTTVGDYAFYGYAGATLEIPATVRQIGASAYAAVENAALTIPAATVSIGRSAFAGVKAVSFAPGSDIRDIGSFAFSEYDGASIMIPDTVERISDYAFYHANLTGLSLENTALMEIGAYAFAYTKLTSFTFPIGTKTVGMGAFAGCKALVTATFPEGNVVESVGSGIFTDCSFLTEITIPFVGRTRESDIYLGYMFGANTYMRNASYVPVTLASVTVLGGEVPGGQGDYSTIVANAFYGCNHLKELVVSEENVAIREGSLVGCTALTDLTLPYGGVIGKLFGGERYSDNVTIVPSTLAKMRFVGVTTIDSYAMYACINVQEIVLPEELTEIGAYAFYNCSRVAKMAIGANVRSIGTNAFARCSSMTEYIVEEANERYVSAEGVLYAFDRETKNAELLAYPLKKSDTYYEIALNIDGEEYAITAIGGYVFHSSTVTEVVVPETVLSIGEFAFYYSKITYLRLPTAEIGQNAFRGCKDMKTVYVDDGGLARLNADSKGVYDNVRYVYVPISICDTLGSNAYISNNFTLLTSEMTGAGVPVSLGETMYYVFYKPGATNISVVPFPTVTSAFGQVKVDGYAYTAGLRYPMGTEVTVSAVPNEGYLFAGWYYDNALLSSSDEYRFVVGSANIRIRAEYFYVGDKYENGDWEIQDVVTMGENDAIRMYVLTTAGRDALLVFEGTGVIDADLSAYADSVTAVRIASGITAVGEGTFAPLKRLTSVALADSVTAIGDRAFYGCARLQSITGGGGLTTVGENAFAGCAALQAFDCTTSLSSIGRHALANTSVVSFTVPKTLSAAGLAEKEIFYKNTSIREIIVERRHSEMVSIDGVAYSYDKSTRTASVVLCPAAMTGEYAILPRFTLNIKEYTVTGIAEYAFCDCSGLTEIAIPATLTEIGAYAFKNCPAEIAWDEDSQITTFGAYSFARYEGFTLSVPGSVTTIREDAFFRCLRLTELVLPQNVSNVAENAFDNCYKLVHLQVLNGSLNVLTPAAMYGEVIGADGTFVNVLTAGEDGIQFLNVPAEDRTMIIGCAGIATRLNLFDLEGIDAIYPYAFYDSRSLTYLSTPAELNYIYPYAFADCEKLSNVTLSAGIGSIAGSAFAGSAITMATIPVSAIGYVPQEKLATLILIEDEGMTSVPEDAFLSCVSLSSLTLRPGITSIERGAFKNCSGLTNVYLADTVESIGESAFENCVRILSMTLPTSVAELGAKAFRGCTGLLQIDLSSVTTIGNDAFRSCTSLSEIVIPDGVSVVSAGLFAECVSLSSVTLADTVEVIDDNAFDGCIGLGHIAIGNTVTRIGEYAYRGCSGVETVSFGSSLQIVDAGAFEDCSGITMVILPASVTSIGDRAFYGTSAGTVVVNAANPTVGQDVFKDVAVINASIPAVMIDSVANAELTMLTIHSGERIESELLSSCDTLSTLEISSAIRSIADGVFDGLPIVGATVPAFAVPYIKSESLETLIVNSGTEIVADAASDCPVLSRVELPATITQIGARAFAGCGTLMVINLPNGLTDIGASAFAGCATIEEVSLPSTVRNIGVGAFMGCTSLKEIVIPENVAYVPENAFRSCTAMQSVTVGVLVENIGDNAFLGCVALSTVYNLSDLVFTAGSEEYGYVAYYATTISAPSYETIGDFMFKIQSTYVLIGYVGTETTAELPLLVEGNPYRVHMSYTPETVIIPDGFESVDVNAFANCTTLRYVVISDSVETIGSGAFRGCVNLLKVTLGTNVETIESGAFEDCVRLSEIYNRSALELSPHGSGNGGVSVYALNVYTEETGSSQLTTRDDFVFVGATMVAYVGEDTEIVLPVWEENAQTVLYHVGNYAFYEMRTITSVSIGASVTAIGAYAVAGCDALETVVIGNSVATIGAYAFRDCSALQTVSIGSGVESIIENAFSGCDALQSVSVASGNGYYASVDSILYAYAGETAHVIVNYSGADAPSTVVIGENEYTVV